MISLDDFKKNKDEVLTNAILNTEKKTYCHYFMECGKTATQITNLNDTLIKVCDNHFEESLNKLNDDSYRGISPRSEQIDDIDQHWLKEELEKLLGLDNIKLKSDDEFFIHIDHIYKNLKLLEKESDSFLLSLASGYVKEFGTVFLILYNGTRDMEKSLQGFDLIKSLTWYIILLDKAFDTKNMDYKIRAESLFKSIMDKTNGSLNHNINHTMAILWTIAEYEIKLKQRMLNEPDGFERDEIFYHILQKSSDTIVYSAVLDHYVENFNPNVMQLYHYNQALLDIRDDFNDVEEDIQNHDLNIFLMASMKTIPIANIINGKNSVKDVKNASSDLILSVITRFETCIGELSVSEEFSFMKKLSRLYIRNLKNLINTA